MKFFTQLWNRFSDFIIHKTVFRGKAGQITLFALKEEEAADADGIVIVCNSYLKDPESRELSNGRVAYAFRFENRYMVHMPIGNRVHAVFQACMRIDKIQPLALVEDGRTYTPTSYYDGVPSQYQTLLTPA
jgi:hypothetical protein